MQQQPKNIWAAIEKLAYVPATRADWRACAGADALFIDDYLIETGASAVSIPGPDGARWQVSESGGVYKAGPDSEDDGLALEELTLLKRDAMEVELDRVELASTIFSVLGSEASSPLEVCEYPVLDGSLVVEGLRVRIGLMMAPGIGGQESCVDRWFLGGSGSPVLLTPKHNERIAKACGTRRIMYWALEDLLIKDGQNLGCDVALGARITSSPLFRDVFGTSVEADRRREDVPSGGKGTVASFSLRCRGTKSYRTKNVKRKMRLWAIRFRGPEFDLPNVVGSEYLVHLLLHCKKDLRPDALITAIEGSCVSTVSDGEANDVMFNNEGQLQVALQWQPDSGQDILDESEIRRYEGMIRDVEIALREGKDDPSLAKDRDVLEVKRDELLAFLVEHTKPGPDGRRLAKRFPNDAFARQSNLLGKHLRKVLKCIQMNDAELWKHLNDKDVLRYGEINRYSPTKGIVWQEISE